MNQPKQNVITGCATGCFELVNQYLPENVKAEVYGEMCHMIRATLLWSEVVCWRTTRQLPSCNGLAAT